MAIFQGASTKFVKAASFASILHSELSFRGFLSSVPGSDNQLACLAVSSQSAVQVRATRHVIRSIEESNCAISVGMDGESGETLSIARSPV